MVSRHVLDEHSSPLSVRVKSESPVIGRASISEVFFIYQKGDKKLGVNTFNIRMITLIFQKKSRDEANFEFD